MPSASFGKPDDAQPSALGATWFVRFTDGKKRKSKVVLCLSDDVVSLIIYSSAAGGTFVQKKTEQLNSIVTGLGGKPSVVFVDIDSTVDKQKIWSTSGKRGVWPLLFKGDEFIGDLEQVIDLNEIEQLRDRLDLN
jgi:hypothetical protein